MNQKRKSLSLLKSITILASLLFIGLLSFSCSSSDDNGNPSTPQIPGLESKNVKLTITIDGALPEDYLSFIAVGSSAENPMNSTIWKVNGATKDNESAVSLNKDFFTGATKTYVVESVTPLSLAKVSMQFLAFGERTYTFSYKAEINGKIVKEEKDVVVREGKNYSHDYTY